MIRFLSRLKNAKWEDTASLAVASVKHAHLLLPLLFEDRSSAVGRYIRSRPEIFDVAYVPFISAKWDPATRIKTALNHIRTVAAIGPAIDVPADTVLNLVDLTSVGPEYRITLDQPRWLFRDGQLAISLWEGVDRLFSVSFSLRTEGADLTAFVGGIQGRRQNAGEEDILERYRRFTKAAHGSRPRDFVVEAFKLFCKSINVTQILAVSDDSHPVKVNKTEFVLSYNDVWQERGGRDQGNGFYALPVGLFARNESEIPAKKRSQYKKRAAMFQEIERQFSEYLAEGRSGRRLPAPAEMHPEVQIGTLDKLLRLTAYALAIFVLASTNLMGGTWIGFCVGLVIVHSTYWLLKGNIPDVARERLTNIIRFRSSSLALRISLAIVAFAIIIALDLQLGEGRYLGRVFKLYFLPIFFSSLFLGTRVTLAVVAASLLALNYLHLPPIRTFTIVTLDDALDLAIFAAMSAIVFLIPRLLLVSLELSRSRKT